MSVDAVIQAWQAAAGINPPTGRQAEILRGMSDKAFELIKVIELELSGIRDGDGYWHGSGVMDSAAREVAALVSEYERATQSEQRNRTPCDCSDMDAADSARALIEAGIDPDDRAAVECTAICPESYRRNPEAFRRFIDAVVVAARYQRDHADESSLF
jgi:hypothetical protein